MFEQIYRYTYRRIPRSNRSDERTKGEAMIDDDYEYRDRRDSWYFIIWPGSRFQELRRTVAESDRGRNLATWSRRFLRRFTERALQALREMLSEEVCHVKVRQLPGPANRYLAKPEKWGGHDCDMLLAYRAISYRSDSASARVRRGRIKSI